MHCLNKCFCHAEQTHAREYLSELWKNYDSAYTVEPHPNTDTGHVGMSPLLSVLTGFHCNRLMMVFKKLFVGVADGHGYQVLGHGPVPNRLLYRHEK